MLNKAILSTGLILSLFFASSAFAVGDVAAGKTKATASCAGCHGAAGVSAVPSYPNLAGQKSVYLTKQLKAFRDKTRIDSMMNGMASSLTDADIDNLAAYYESIK